MVKMGEAEILRIASKLDAAVVCELPDYSAGLFEVAKVIAVLKERLAALKAISPEGDGQS